MRVDVTPVSVLLAALHDLARLPANWDSYGADPVEAKAIAQAEGVLSDLEIGDLPLPSHVAPTPEGGVQLEWQLPTKLVEMAIDQSGGIRSLVDRGRSAGATRFAEERPASRAQAQRLLATELRSA